MEIAVSDKAPSVRIISGPPEIVERDVNSLLEVYAPIVWNIQSCDGKPLVTCILIHEREIRKSQLAAMRMVPQGVPGIRQ